LIGTGEAMVNTVAGVQIGTKLSVNFMTNIQKLHRGIWPWTIGLKSRLPLHYKRRYIERFMHEPRPVHFRADERKFVADKYGNPVRVQNVPIPVVYPREANEGLWGGEGIVAGFRKKADDPMKPRNARIWLPYLTKRVLYSEILDRWMAVTVTRRTMDLIDAAFGLDNYILSTPDYEIRSTFGMRLKREMLRAIAQKSMYPDNPVKRDTVYEKFRKYELPAEEVDWIGLSLYEAEMKQNEIEEAERLRNLRPLKDVYADELAQQLKENMITQDVAQPKSWLHKLNPFQEKKGDN
jgi:large subunit ribosomal protein L28